jgi:replicative DNA helicase
VVVVDILHLIEHREERDLAEISSTLNRTAKLANCAIIATVHLNEKRVTDVERPKPTIGDIRGSGSLKNDADIVAFIWRAQDLETGDPLNDGGLLYVSKVRGGKTGGMAVEFDDEFLVFRRARKPDEAPIQQWS